MQSPVEWPRTQKVLAILQLKWTTAILECIRVRPYRALEIRAELGISGKVLTQSMRHLGDQDVVQSRAIPAQPPGIAYELTDRGKKIVELLDALNQACVDHGLASPATPVGAGQPDQESPDLPPPAAPPATKPPATWASGTEPATGPAVGPAVGGDPGEAFRRPNIARMYDYLLGGYFL